MLNLQTPYYTVSALVFEQNENNFGAVKLNILINKASDFTPHLYAALNRLENEYIISICAPILEDRNLLTGLLPKIYILLALNKPLHSQRIIPIFSDAQHQSQALNIAMVQAYLNDQGLHNLKLPIFDCTLTNVQTTIDGCSLFIAHEQPVELQNLLLGKKEHSTKMIIAFRNENDDFTIPAGLKEQLLVNEREYAQHAAISRFYIAKEEFESETELWRKRTLLYKDFLSLSKKVQEKEYYDVLDWYTKEYEVLPLWFKRIGHIVKAVTGKRTVQSLFSDKVKKYKQ